MASQPRRVRGSAALVLSLVVLVPILYVLSVGPAVMLVELTGTEDELGPALNVVYYPVVWLYENTLLEEPIEAYVALWRDWW